jgi:hypothetical protein
MPAYAGIQILNSGFRRNDDASVGVLNPIENKAKDKVIGMSLIFARDFNLSQNYPNPFNPSTTIRYSLPNRSSVRIVVTNTLGQQMAMVENGEREAGIHEVEWHAQVASGIYFYRMNAVSVSDPHDRFMQAKKILLLK